MTDYKTYNNFYENPSRSVETLFATQSFYYNSSPKTEKLQPRNHPYRKSEQREALDRKKSQKESGEEERIRATFLSMEGKE